MITTNRTQSIQFSAVSMLCSIAILLSGTKAEESRSPNVALFMPEYQTYRDQLELQGVSLTRESLSQYLQRTPGATDEERRLFRELVQDLGDDDFRTREKASRKLLAVRAEFEDQLQRLAKDHDDLEVRIRADDALRALSRLRSIRPISALFVIARDCIPGLTSEVLNILDNDEREFALIAARLALVSTVTNADASLLIDHIEQSKSSFAQASCAAALGMLDGSNVDDRLISLTTHDSDHVKFWAARALAIRGDASSLEILVDLLESPEYEVRFRVAELLRDWQQQCFDYRAYAENRDAAVKRWRTHIASNSAIRTPYRPSGPKGRVLVANESAAVELGSDGNTVHRQSGFSLVRDASVFESGRFLFSDMREQTVFEFDPKWRLAAIDKSRSIEPNFVRRLANGTTVVANKTKMQFWGESKNDVKIAFSNIRCMATIGNGTIIGGYNKIAEIDTSSKIVWDMPLEYSPRSVEFLEDGRLLVVDFKQVCIYEPNNPQPILRCDNSGTITASGLASGNLVLSDEMGLKVVCRNNRILWQQPQQQFVRAKVIAF
ncbi:MAG: HEAT repeat domain-containing protein [Planctomycetales bacterium]|nr:HEAT repeat domain-containing protein [Planctomycetales bacterium]